MLQVAELGDLVLLEDEVMFILEQLVSRPQRTSVRSNFISLKATARFYSWKIRAKTLE